MLPVSVIPARSCGGPTNRRLHNFQFYSLGAAWSLEPECFVPVYVLTILAAIRFYARITCGMTYGALGDLNQLNIVLQQFSSDEAMHQHRKVHPSDITLAAGGQPALLHQHRGLRVGLPDRPPVPRPVLPLLRPRPGGAQARVRHRRAPPQRGQVPHPGPTAGGILKIEL